MKNFVRITPVFATFALAACATPWTDTTTALSMTTSNETAQALRPHAAAPAPGFALRALLQEESQKDAANPGTVNAISYQKHYLEAAAGLTVETAESTFKPATVGAAGTYSAQVSSVCGLLDVLSEAQLHTRLRAKGGDITGSTAFRTSNGYEGETTFRTRLDGLDAAGANLCRPAPGAAFSFVARTTVQRDLKREGTPDMSKALSQSRKHRCVSGTDLQAAAALDPSLKGNYIKVSCDTQNEHGRDVKTDYAYLLESQMYLPLARTIGQGTVSYSYRAAVYDR